MSKKHFIKLADAMRLCKPTDSSNEYGMTALKQWEQDVQGIAAFCQEMNPNFNRYRWLGYINGTNGPSGGAI